MRASRGVLLATAVALAVVTVSPAAAAPPPASGLVLATTDFPKGATLLSQSAAPSPFLPKLAASSAYTRSFEGVLVGHTRIIQLVSSAIVARDEAKVSSYMNELVTTIRSKLGRQEVLAIVKQAFAASTRQKVTGAGFTRARTLHVGDSTLEISLWIAVKGTRIDIGEIFMQVGPALEYVTLSSGEPGLTAGEATSLAKSLARHAQAASQPAPVETALPSITGTLGAGQILTAHPGTWTGTDIAYTYQWYRCNPAGAACVAIEGSTQPSYTISTADLGRTVAVSATATNPAGHATALSPATAVIQG